MRSGGARAKPARLSAAVPGAICPVWYISWRIPTESIPVPIPADAAIERYPAGTDLDAAATANWFIVSASKTSELSRVLILELPKWQSRRSATLSFGVPKPNAGLAKLPDATAPVSSWRTLRLDTAESVFSRIHAGFSHCFISHYHADECYIWSPTHHIGTRGGWKHCWWRRCKITTTSDLVCPISASAPTVSTCINHAWRLSNLRLYFIGVAIRVGL